MDFTKLSRLLLPNVIEGILKSRRYSHVRLTENLSDLQFSTKSVLQTKDDLIIELQVLDDELLYNLLSGEANNFLLASRLSFDRAFQMQENNAAWQAVEHYYAAYYAIHYLLRITGISLTNLDSNATSAILRNQFSATKVSTISSGLYTLRYDEKSKIITLSKKLNKKAGGSHKDAWQLWMEMVEKLQLNTKIDPVEYLKESLNLLEHKNFIIKSVDKYNPPELRGEINYQFVGGSWIFEKNSRKSIHQIQNIISNSNLSTINSKIKMEAMIANNTIIINLAKALFLHTAKSYPESICSSLANKYKAYIV